MGIEGQRSLPSWMIDLHPEMIANGCAGSSPGFQRIETGAAVNHNVAGALHMLSSTITSPENSNPAPPCDHRW